MVAEVASTGPAEESPRQPARTTMTHGAVAALRDMIVLGEIPPGAPLRLEELASRLNMSVSPIREAIRQLEILGLAEHAPYKGASVTLLSVSEMVSVYEARLAVESLIVRQAARHFDQEADELLSGLLAEFDRAYAVRDRARVVRLNTEFHVSLANIADSRLYKALAQHIHNVWERYSGALILNDEPERTFDVEVAGHRAILAALRAADPDLAESAMRSHLAGSRDIFGRISPQFLVETGRVQS